jgi:multimeric flavodoxin WrbA
MAKKIVIVIGSPRENGNSTILAEQVASGARISGAEVEVFNLHKLAISPCNACDACRKENSGGCTINDDMQMLYPKLKAADAIVIASPVYWFSVSAQTKLFIDRFYGMGEHPNNVLKGKEIGIILTYADADPFISGAVNALRMFQDIFNYVGAKIVGMVYGTAWKVGEIESNREVMDKAYELGKTLAASK